MDDRDEQVTQLGVHPETGERVTIVVSKTKLAMAELREAGVPMYEVPALQDAAKDQRRQATELREKASDLEKKAGEFEALVAICARRDMELAAKGMKLENGRVVLVDGNRVRPG